MTEKNDYDDHSNTLPLTVNEFTLSHWTDRVAVHFLEHGSWCVAMRFDKLSRSEVETTMSKILGLYKTTIYKVTFDRAKRVARVDYKGRWGHTWTALENVESVYNDRW